MAVRGAVRYYLLGFLNVLSVNSTLAQKEKGNVTQRANIKSMQPNEEHRLDSICF